ncbi:hypothetical protein BT93_H2797 [Corymbia citriodora subsp. variegata]|nr:hypothetical protein BT93_H2797 [Corymbia citriodora subsp. variegata]
MSRALHCTKFITRGIIVESSHACGWGPADVVVLGALLGSCPNRITEAADSMTKPGCHSACGNLSIPYPFGMRDSRSKRSINHPSFIIDCDNSIDPPVPYLYKKSSNIKILNISIENHEMRVKVFSTRKCYNAYGRTGTKNKFIAIGCDTLASFLDLDGNFSFRCMSSCSSVLVVSNDFGYKIFISSFYKHTYVLDFNPCSYGFVTKIGSYNFSVGDLKQLEFNQSTLLLDWTIGNQTCKDAKKNSVSYMCTNNTICTDAKNGFGYKCTCKVGVAGATIALLLSIGFLYLGHKKMKLTKLKEQYFKQNGGLLLQQQLDGSDRTTKAMKIFSFEGLEKATKNYNESRIVGQGGYGTVYKGSLPNGTVVAIKKSKLVDRNQIEQFINEVTMLSQINHHNVVKLLGCCLETDVPLLVYEFVNNGTLFDHIHNPDKSSKLSWETWLRIASETAGVLSYLHSAASIPIIHRDVKSANILLDANYTTKVFDFGASRLVPLDQTQLFTMVKGTWGYLDPEYLHTSQLTEKSDVYSFGVVLVELLTRKKALSFDRLEEERSLAMYFLSSLGNDKLFQIVEDIIANEGINEQVREVTNLAKRCLTIKGEERPTMKEVAIELEGLRAMIVHLSGEKTNIYMDTSGTMTSGYPATMEEHLIPIVSSGR